ncbi:MAG: FMN-binding negative transcriptional regulator [Zoogloeaceae bacterium]|nr:FMN-binding negative transcriptional regulator [Rhodocyclaceae bacterium]MCP5234354.1 FMN-binding negative transcriptional regulator [Zoogloeaceae bacterium]
MYCPRHFEAPDRQAMLALIDDAPLATLVVGSEGGLQAEHLPLLRFDNADGRCRLRGHVARANPIWRGTLAGVAALAVFRRDSHYVSPGWYPSKQDHGKVVPTWNYTVVHVHGVLTAIEDRGWLREFLGQLTARHEAMFERPWRVEDAPPDYIDKMLAAVVGIELTVERLQGKWKLSQNRPAPDRAGVVAGLATLGTGPAVAMADVISAIDEDMADQ